MPVTASALLRWTGGATAGLVLYYGACCVGVVWWRRGSLEYHWPARWPWVLFGASLLIPLGLAALNFGHLPDSNATAIGFVLTLLIWAPLNGAMEQLSWFYVLDAWRTRWRAGFLRWIGLGIGILLLLTLIALIHILFWAQFLPTAETSAAWMGGVRQLLHTLLTVSYGGLYYRSGSWWPTFVIHLLADVQLVFLANYSIVPYL